MTSRRKLAPGSRLVVASHNPGKVREIAALLAAHHLDITSAAQQGLAEPDETADSFLGNAGLKALAAAQASGLPALADDSGLCVAALDGAPGIHSARWGGPAKDFALAMRKVEDALQAKGIRPDAMPAERAAHFACALALAWPDGHAEAFEGRVHGHVCWPPRGTRGFGYDPIFVPLGDARTFGEFDPAEKHAISHRAAAFKLLVAGCF